MFADNEGGWALQPAAGRAAISEEEAKARERCAGRGEGELLEYQGWATGHTARSSELTPVKSGCSHHILLMPEMLSTLVDAGVGFLTLNTVVAFYRSREDPWTASFVVFAYGNVLSLFYCLRSLERAHPGDHSKREQLKRAILLLATTLNMTFTHQVSKVLPPALSAAVWCLACSVTAAGFYLFCFLSK
ncbi:hypothetical protein Taro_035829 [Colocasia esculenta]|uniref:Uncharacterized protein n=1 Tax=Colocasia esculenta TaxID=4460 RepID=A0A843W4Z2_COLES|nr:hypothetical protein [Colocasia esculenta]